MVGGFSTEQKGNAIALARTPNYDEICKKYPPDNSCCIWRKSWLNARSSGKFRSWTSEFRDWDESLKQNEHELPKQLKTGEFF